MLVWIQLLETEPEFLQHRAAVGVIFELLQALPGDVERRVAGHDVSNEAFARLPIGKQADHVSGIGGQYEIGGEAALVNRQHTRVQLIEVSWIRLVGPKINEAAVRG